MRHYSLTELEMYALAINIANFAHLLKIVDFNAIIDHLVLTHIIKGKTEPTATRIKRLSGVLNSHSFKLYYKEEKGYDT